MAVMFSDSICLAGVPGRAARAALTQQPINEKPSRDRRARG
jgi:hypothetical protein